MIDNFATYSNELLNIRDRSRFLIHIKDDLNSLINNLNNLSDFIDFEVEAE